MRWPIVLVLILAVCAFIYWEHQEPSSDEMPAQENIASGVSHPHGVIENWAADSKSLDIMDAHYNDFRTKILLYFTDPGLASYHQAVSDLMGISDVEHETIHSRCRAAIQSQNGDRFAFYSAIESNTVEVLNEVKDAAEYQQADSYTRIHDPTYNTSYDPRTQAQSQIKDAQHSSAPDVFREYSQDSESISRFGQSPAELSVLEADAATRIEQAQSLLANGDELGAQLAAETANMDQYYVSTLLWEYDEDVYMPRFLGFKAPADK
jgi:hypothetical protein